MEILNVGPLELIIILVLMFIVLGPKDMVKTAQRIGRWVRSVTTSPMWREVWGISQDIRELPKKLMEDTGLEEALTDVKQTTQQVANELNAQINEAKEAARVPEVEHLRIETNPFAAPPPGSVPAPAVLPSTVETAGADSVQSAEVTVPGEGTQETASIEQPAVLHVAESAGQEEAAPAPVKKPRRKKVAATEQQAGTEPPLMEPPAAETSSDGSTPAEPVKKPRRRKQPIPKEQVPSALGVEPLAVVEETQAAEQMPAAAESAVAVYATESQLASSLVAAETSVESPALEKKTRRKKQPVITERADSGAGHDNGASAMTHALSETPAMPAAATTVPPEMVHDPAPQKRRARKTAPAATMPVVAAVETTAEAVVGAGAETAPTNGQAGNNGTETRTPPKPITRKRRAARGAQDMAPETQQEPSEQPDRDAA